jgi:hypothetical protein
MEVNITKRNSMFIVERDNLMATALSVYPSRRSPKEFRTILIGWTIKNFFSYATFISIKSKSKRKDCIEQSTDSLQKLSKHQKFQF